MYYVGTTNPLVSTYYNLRKDELFFPRSLFTINHIFIDSLKNTYLM